MWIDKDDSRVNLAVAELDLSQLTTPASGCEDSSLRRVESEIRWEFGDVPL